MERELQTTQSRRPRQAGISRKGSQIPVTLQRFVVKVFLCRLTSRFIIFHNSIHSVGRSIAYFDTIQSALEFFDDAESPLVFVHKGSYQREYLVVENNVNILGCSSGNVAENVTIERDTESTVTFMEGARSSYLGYVTLKFSPDISSSVPHHKHYCLEIGENCSPLIDHCIIRSSSVGKFFFVKL